MTVEIRRNDKCPCGSGLKYKKCCMTKKDVTQHNMPKYREIMRPDGRSSYQVFWLDNVEKTNPIEYYKNAESDEDEAEKAANKGEAEIIIAKHRNGPVGTVKLLFQGNITKFKNPIKTDVF